MALMVRALVAAIVVVFAAAMPAFAAELKVRIDGDAVVGSQLRATVEPTGDAPVSYQWLRCSRDDDEDDEDDRRCERIGANAPDYTPSTDDVGSRIAVRVVGADKATGRSRRTREVVQADPTPPPPPTPSGSPQPAPSPVPTPSPEPSPSPSGSPPPATGPAGTPAPGAAPTPAPYMRPFPVVRVKGSVVGDGAAITLLRVSGPRRADVRVKCTGRGCPVRRLSRHKGRIRAFERFLPAGIRITVRVTRPGFVGKHVRLVIRASRAPARRDACALPGRKRAVACPSA